jgi:hypothetical protein
MHEQEKGPGAEWAAREAGVLHPDGSNAKHTPTGAQGQRRSRRRKLAFADWMQPAANVAGRRRFELTARALWWAYRGRLP